MAKPKRQDDDGQVRPVRSPEAARWTLLVLTVINCLGVRSGSNTQSLLMILKLLAIAALLGSAAMFAQPRAGRKPRRRGQAGIDVSFHIKLERRCIR